MNDWTYWWHLIEKERPRGKYRTKRKRGNNRTKRMMENKV